MMKMSDFPDETTNWNDVLRLIKQIPIENLKRKANEAKNSWERDLWQTLYNHRLDEKHN